MVGSIVASFGNHAVEMGFSLIVWEINTIAKKCYKRMGLQKLNAYPVRTGEGLECDWAPILAFLRNPIRLMTLINCAILMDGEQKAGLLRITEACGMGPQKGTGVREGRGRLGPTSQPSQSTGSLWGLIGRKMGPHGHLSNWDR